MRLQGGHLLGAFSNQGRNNGCLKGADGKVDEGKQSNLRNIKDIKLTKLN